MPTFTTTITRTRQRCGLELLAIAYDKERDEDNLDPEEEIVLEIEVDYEPGWFTPGKYSGDPDSCYPDEGEDAEILRVTILDDNSETDPIEINNLTSVEYMHLSRMAMEEAEAHELDADYDAAEALYDELHEDQWIDDYDGIF